MSYIKCKKCGKDYYEDDSNPNIHYSDNNVQLCGWCKNYESLKVGEWYQDSKGDFIQKK